MSNFVHKERKISYTALGMTIGLILGGIVGLKANNMILFSGGGLVLGLAVGSAQDSRRRTDQAEAISLTRRHVSARGRRGIAS